MPLSMAISVSLGPACCPTLVTTTRTADSTSMCGYSVSSSHRLSRRRSFVALLLGEDDLGLAVVGLLGQELVHPVLELGGDAAEGEPRRRGRAGTSSAAEHAAPATAPSAAEAHQCAPLLEPGWLPLAIPSPAAASGSTWARTSA